MVPKSLPSKGLRISALKLKIEIGRYAIPQIPADCRLCTLRNHEEVEAEFHLLLKCTCYKKERNNLLSSVASKAPNFVDLDDYDKFI
jgi:hypothetical protein